MRQTAILILLLLLGLAAFWSLRTGDTPARAGAVPAQPDAAPPEDLQPGDGQKAMAAEARESMSAPSKAEGAAPTAAFHLLIRCVDPEGKALHGVPARLGKDRRAAVLARSAADGELRVPVVGRRSRMLDLVLGGEAWICEMRRVNNEVGAGVESVRLADVTLLPACRVTMTVVDGGGAAVAEASVWADQRGVSSPVSWPPQTGRCFWLQADRTDGQGRAEILLPRGMRTFFRLARFGYEATRTEVSRIPDLAEHDLGTLRLVEENPAERIRGRVLDAAGKGRAHAEVLARDAGGVRARARTRYGADAGAFSLRVEAGKVYDILVQEADGQESRVQRRNVAAGTQDLLIRLGEGTPGQRELQLILSDEAGAAIASASFQRNSGSRMVPVRATRPEPGTFELALPADAEGLSIYSPGKQQKVLPLQPWPGSPLHVQLHPQPGFRLRVQHQGQPMVGATVHWHSPGERLGTHVEALFSRLGYRRNVLGRTDAEGRIRVPIYGEGPIILHVEKQGMARAELGPLELSRDGDREHLVEVPAAGVLHGKVLVAEGVTATGWLIAASRGDAHVHTATVAADGSYRLTGLAPGAYHLIRCRRANHSRQDWNRIIPQGDRLELPAGIHLAPGQTLRHDLDLRDEVPSRLVGRVFVDGQPMAGWFVSARLGVSYLRSQTDAQGRFALRNHRAEEVELRASGTDPGLRLSYFGKQRFAPQPRPLRLALRTGSLEIEGLQDAGVADRKFTLMGPDDGGGRWSLYFVADQHGKARLDKVPTGRLQLRGTSKGVVLAELDLQTASHKKFVYTKK